jgi:hypothetical protein
VPVLLVIGPNGKLVLKENALLIGDPIPGLRQKANGVSRGIPMHLAQ